MPKNYRSQKPETVTKSLSMDDSKKCLAWVKKKKDIKIIIVVTNNLSVRQAAKLLLPAMPYFHNTLKPTVEILQEHRSQPQGSSGA